jgi:lipoteichoic acid synthase
MAYLVQTLEDAGIADDTVIVLVADHYPYGLSNRELTELFGYAPTNLFTRDHNRLIIWSGCLEDMDLVVEEPVSSLDILPTLSNLFGVEYDSRMMTGRDVFSDSEAVVFWPLTYSWKTAKGFYNSATGVFTPAEGVEVPENYVESVTAKVKNKCVFSKAVQQHNYYSVISALVNLEDAG